MLDGKTVGVVIPAYNEEHFIGEVLRTMPDFVDAMIVVNDGSTDGTRAIVESFRKDEPRTEHVDHETNRGLGQSLIDGYLRARAKGLDVVAVMAGDAQMSPGDLANVVGPVVQGQADYVKGNRLLREDVAERMPRHRLIGNSVLTLLTKFATGYWQIIDPQCGYTAISKEALNSIPIERMVKGYGYNADILNMLNLNNFMVCDVEVEPVYGEQKSKIRLSNYIPKVSCLLIRLFLKRMVHKYLIREFHPLVFFYAFSFFNGVVLALPLLVRFFYLYAQQGQAPSTTLILLTFSTSMALLSLFFGMWLDMEDNRKLIAVLPTKRRRL